MVANIFIYHVYIAFIDTHDKKYIYIFLYRMYLAFIYIYQLLPKYFRLFGVHLSNSSFKHFISISHKHGPFFS